MVMRCPACSTMVVDSMSACPVCGRDLGSGAGPEPSGGAPAGATLAGAAASAWASAMDVPTTAISSTIHGLTPVVLTHATAVTVHNLAEGHPGTYQAVLQAGNVVFVDAHGTPVVDAASGDPLSPPQGGAADDDVTFHGDAWDGFDQHAVTTVDASHTELTTIDGIDIHTGAPTTIGVGGTVSLDGYLVSDEHGVSVVSFDGKTRTQIVDHEVGRAFGDGMGGIVYEDSFASNLRGSAKRPQAIMWLPAGTATARKLVSADASTGMALRALATGHFDGTQVLFYARQATASGDGVSEQGVASQLIVRDLQSGTEHRIVASPALGEGAGPLAFLALQADEGEVGEHHLIFQGTQGMSPNFFSVNDEYQVSAVTSQVCNLSPPGEPADFDGCRGAAMTFDSDARVDFLISTTTGSQRTSALVEVDLSTDSVLSQTKLHGSTVPLCRGGLEHMSGDSTRPVVSFGPSNGVWPGCNAVLVDAKKKTVTELPFAGIVAPLAAPVIRAATTEDRAPSSATTPSPTTTTPAPTTTTRTTPTSTTTPPPPQGAPTRLEAGGIAPSGCAVTGIEWFDPSLGISLDLSQAAARASGIGTSTFAVASNVEVILLDQNGNRVMSDTAGLQAFASANRGASMLACKDSAQEISWIEQVPAGTGRQWNM